MLFGLFKKKPKKEQLEEDVAVGSTNIRYKPGLVDDLKSDHENLLNIYTDIKLSAEMNNFTKTAEHLTDFRNQLEDHLLKENINLYIYLTHLLEDDKENSTLISSFRKEMDGIASIALKFLAKYESIGSDKELQKSFQDDFSVIGDVLGKRIKREESMLYTLYAPPRDLNADA